MTYIAVAVAAFIAGAVIWRHRTRPTVAHHHAESYWAGYRRGHDDGQLFRAVIERTPNPN